MHGQFYADPTSSNLHRRSCICLHQEQSIDDEQRRHPALTQKIDIQEDITSKRDYTMSGKYVFSQALKEVRFLFCQTGEHSGPTRSVKYTSSPTYEIPNMKSVLVPVCVRIAGTSKALRVGK